MSIKDWPKEERPRERLFEKGASSLSDAEAWKLVYSISPKKPRDNRLEICFTGFGVTKKKTLNDLASRKNMKVVNSVTKNLHILCIGENAGPKKIEKAKAQGVEIINEKQLSEFLEKAD